MHAHGRFEQEAWTYDAETLDVYREFVLLHERLVPYVRAAAATAARCGLPIIRPLLLSDPHDPRGWAMADGYGYGPSLWVAPVLEAGARRARGRAARGRLDRLLDRRGGDAGGGHDARRAGAARPHPGLGPPRRADRHLPGRARRARGSATRRSAERPLEATLWGEPPCGRALARLADGTEVRWTRGEWSAPAGREVSFGVRG